MHELSLCEGLLRQVQKLALEHGARAVARVELEVGVLCGAEPLLLRHAFEAARRGTLCEQAELSLRTVPARVYCADCARESPCPANDLRCALCRGPHTELRAGDELTLARVELLRPKAPAARAQGASAPEPTLRREKHV